MEKLKGDVRPLYLLGFFVVVNYTILSPTILPFIISLTNDDMGTLIYALEMSCNAISQVACAILAGVLAKRYPMKVLFIGFQAITVVGSVIYCFAAWPFNSAWIILASRFIVGAQGAIGGLAPSYISAVKQDKGERLVTLANFRAVCLFIVAGLMTLIPTFSIGPYEMSEYVSSSWVNFIAQLIGLFICIFLIKNIDKDGNMSNDDQLQQERPKGIYLSTGVILSFIVYLFFGYAITTISYLMPVVLIEGYNWSTSAYSVVVIIFSIVGIAGSLAVRLIAKYLKNHTYFTIVPMIGGVAVSVVISSLAIVGVNQLEEWVAAMFFVVGIEASFFFFSIVQSVLSSTFTQIIPREYVVSMMPLLSAIYAIGKIVGPIICEIEVQLMDVGLVYFVFFIVSAIILFVTILLSHHFSSSHMVAAIPEDINQNPTDSKKAFYDK